MLGDRGGQGIELAELEQVGHAPVHALQLGLAVPRRLRRGHQLVGDGQPLLGVVRGPERHVPGAQRLEQRSAAAAPPGAHGLVAQALAQRRRRLVVDLDRQPREQPRAQLGVLGHGVQGLLEQRPHVFPDGADGHGQPRGAERRTRQQLVVPERARQPRRLVEAEPSGRRVAQALMGAGQAQQHLRAKRIALVEVARGGTLEQVGGVLVGERAHRLRGGAQRAGRRGAGVHERAGIEEMPRPLGQPAVAGQRLERLRQPPVQQRTARAGQPGDHRLAHQRVGEAVVTGGRRLVDQPGGHRRVEAVGDGLVAQLAGGRQVREREVLAGHGRQSHGLGGRLRQAREPPVDQRAHPLGHLHAGGLHQRLGRAAGVGLDQMAHQLLDEERVRHPCGAGWPRPARATPVRRATCRPGRPSRPRTGRPAPRARGAARAAGRRAARAARAGPRRPRRAASRPRAAAPGPACGARARASPASHRRPSAGPRRSAAPGPGGRRIRSSRPRPRTGDGERPAARPRAARPSGASSGSRRASSPDTQPGSAAPAPAT